MFGAVQDCCGDEIGCVHRRWVLRLDGHKVLRVTSVRRVDRARLDQCYGDWRAFFFKLETKRVGVASDCMFGCAVCALEWNGDVREDADDIDQRAALVSQ